MRSLALLPVTYLALACGSFTALAQSNQASPLSDPCAAATSSSLQDLERRKLSLEQAIVVAKAQNESLATASAKPELRQQLAASQASLIDVLYKLECYRSDLQRTAEVLRGSQAALTMTLFYATNRRASDSGQLHSFYGAEDTRSLAYGTTTISIPSLHKPGELELPRLWKLEWTPNPSRHFVVRSVTPLDSAQARAQISANGTGLRSKSLLIFVHGYNVNFVEASFRTAQLAYDLRFPGLAMFYSWPSAGSSAGYLHDQESVQLARSIFDQFLDEVSALQFDQIYIVAHSMGNRVVSEAVASRVQNGKDVGKIREMLFAAPDINVEIFKSDVAPKLAGIRTARRTIYASSKDVALKASSVMHGFPRVGDTRPEVFIYSGFDTIDASEAAPLWRSFGHSYVLDSSVVLNDLEDVLVWRRPLADRVLRPLGIAPNRYWGLR